MKSVFEIRHVEDVTVDWSKESYEDIYATNQIRHIVSFYQWLLDLLNTQPGKRLLDVSCGVGSLPQIAAKEKQLRAHGVDFSAVAVRLGQQESDEVCFTVGDAESLPYPDASFDYVTNIGSIEHYLHPELGVREMARILKPGGRACILLPNIFGILGNIWTALRTGRTFDDGQPLQRYAARLEWQELLEDGGLKVIRTVKYERVFPRNFEDVCWYFKHPKDLVRLFLSPLVPLNWANYFVYLCGKDR